VKKSWRYVSVAARGIVSLCKTGPPRGALHKRTRTCRSPRSDRIAMAGVTGADAFVLSGWVGGVALPPAKYRLTVQAFGAAMTASAPAVAHFTIAAPARR
jgi:hypothetical protein